MLSEQDKARIKLEEIYRREILQEIKGPKTRYERFSNFFSTSLGHWILTSLLVGLFTYSFNFFQERNERIGKTKELVKRIDYEMQSRLYQYDALLTTLTVMKSTNAEDSVTGLGSSHFMQHFVQTGLYDTWLKFKNAIQFELLSIEYSEFGNRSMPSLITELINHTEEAEEKERLGKIRLFIMSDGLFPSPKLRSMNPDVDEIHQIQVSLRENILIPRWRIE